VVVDLGHGRSVPGEILLAALVGVHNGVVDPWGIFPEPGEQGGPEVEAHPRIVIENADDLVVLVDDARGAIGRITLGGDAVVPVVPRSGRLLGLDGFQPGVFARRLVKMAVDADGSFGGAHGAPSD